MSNDLLVRRAERTDIALVLDFIRELAEYERLTYEMKACEGDLEKWLFGEHPVAEALVADYACQPAGFALFFHNFSTFLGKPGIYLEDLFVRPALRGKGVGKALLREVVRLAKERGCGRVEWAVLDWNRPAISFYESLGARPLDDWTVYRLDAVGIVSLLQEVE